MKLMHCPNSLFAGFVGQPMRKKDGSVSKNRNGETVSLQSFAVVS